MSKKNSTGKFVLGAAIGAATSIALPNTYRVLSSILLTITLPILIFL